MEYWTLTSVNTGNKLYQGNDPPRGPACVLHSIENAESEPQEGN